MIEEALEEMKLKMDKSIGALRRELAKVRTGRASTALLEGIRVDYYGSSTPLNQMATLSVPESRLITIQPWDVGALADIEKAILKSDVGLTPNNDGKIIRLNVPALTEERRREMVKLAKRIGEDCRVAVRNARRETNEFLKDLEKEKEISEDNLKRSYDLVQNITNDYIKKIDNIIKAKETDVMEV